ncbi:ribosomal protein S18 acetylase RimI-like enzyme [Elusimicrobium posterum]|uniref:GNAT family N-acetyltransferase n=1 Tax=Elusimicrobium posterum TaxID=3116653 RepID=UPI003C76173A
MKIRKATQKDIKQINLLYKKQFSAMKEFRPDLFNAAKSDEGRISAYIKNPKNLMLVAQDNEKIVAFLSAEEQQTMPFAFLVPHKFAQLWDIFVDKPYRGSGLAEKLLNNLVKWGEKRNLDFVRLNVLAQNSRAISFYRKKGFKETTLIFDKPLKTKNLK